ncbi:Response regulator containing CheY-like receiver, AAA-type ATPase, and DNA-binding domains [Vogesella sp. LIG4]|nr:Response regulator containing CheY-like receiver, AAA-type ATPase, and DNA-binding domains [Vogesella sp. LIG4]
MKVVDYSKLRVLVVDDQLLVRTLLSRALRDLGVAEEGIYQAVDGATAKRALDAKTVDLVLCDLQMEPINGMDLLKEIRCGMTLNASTLPFVFLSGHAERDNIVLAAKLHADGFIIKPPKPAELERHLQEALSRPRPEPDPFAYCSIPTGTRHDKYLFSEMIEEAARAMDEDQTPVEAVALEEVKPGRVLGADLRTGSGHLLLQRGASITRTQLRVLQEHAERFGVSHLVLTWTEHP